MSHPGWFHRTGSGPGSLKWTPAGTTEGTGSSPPQQHHPVTTTPPNGRFPVGEVNGNTPTDLTAFLGVATFTVIRGDLTYRIFGTGHATSGAVTFRQQDPNWDGRYIRTWTITTTPDGIHAQPAPPSCAC
jgi:hypothetical protein